MTDSRVASLLLTVMGLAALFGITTEPPTPPVKPDTTKHYWTAPMSKDSIGWWSDIRYT